MSALPTHARPAAKARRQRRPTLRVVGPPRHTARFLALSVAVIAAGVFGIVSLSALAAETAFTARALEGEVAEYHNRYEELTAEVAALEAPARVHRVAVDDLGMVPAEQPAYLLVDDGPALVPVSHTSGAGADDGAVLADPLKPALRAGR